MACTELSNVTVYLLIYTVSQKMSHFVIVQVFAKFWPIFEIFALMHSVDNYQ